MNQDQRISQSGVSNLGADSVNGSAASVTERAAASLHSIPASNCCCTAHASMTTVLTDLHV